MHIIADVNKILKTVQRNLTFILKRMLVFSHKMVFIENEAALLCVTVGDVQGHLQLQSSVQRFHIAFAIKKFSFFGSLFKHILAWKRDISKRYFLV